MVESITDPVEKTRQRRLRSKPKNANKRTYYRLLAVFIIIILSATAFFSVDYFVDVNKEPIRIGVILSLTGSGAASTIDVRDALLIAVDEINARNHLNGREIQLIIRDCESNSSKAVEIYADIETEYHPLMYISAVSSIAIALAPLAEENETPLVAVVTSSDTVTAGMDWVFRYYFGAKEEVRPALIKMDFLEVEKLGLIYINDEYGNSVLNAFLPKVESRGIQFEYEGFEPWADDFSLQVQNLSENDAIFAVGLTSYYEGILQELRDTDYAGHIFLGSGAATPSVRELMVANGAYVSAPNIYRPAYSYSDRLENSFQALYNRSITHQGASGYDAIKFLSSLLIDQEVSRENVRNLLLKGFVYNGVLGNICVSPGDHNFAIPLFPAKVINEELVYQ